MNANLIHGSLAYWITVFYIQNKFLASTVLSWAFQITYIQTFNLFYQFLNEDEIWGYGDPSKSIQQVISGREP